MGPRSHVALSFGTHKIWLGMSCNVLSICEQRSLLQLFMQQPEYFWFVKLRDWQTFLKWKTRNVGLMLSEEVEELFNVNVLVCRYFFWIRLLK